MTDLVHSLAFLLYLLVMVSPGWVLARCLRGRGWIATKAEQLVIGYGLGIVWTILISILALSLSVPVALLPVASLLLALGLLRLPAVGERRPLAPAGFWWGHQGIIWLAAIAVALTVIVILRVGHVEDGRHLFTTLFVNDYFNHMAVTAELAKNVPPRNIYFAGSPAHYYWFFHIIPAAFYRLTEMSVNLRCLLLTLASVNIAVLMVALWALVSRFRVAAREAALTIAMILVAYSYVDIFLVGRWLGRLVGLPHVLPQSLWARLEGFSGLSHSFVRDFWVEPHSVTAVLLTVTAILIYRGASWRGPAFVRGLLAGLPAVCALGCDSFVGLVLILWLGVDLAFDLWKRPDKRRTILWMVPGFFIAGVIGLAYLVGFSVIGSQTRMLSFQPLTGVIATLPFYLVLDYGPLFLFGLIGWIMIWRSDDVPHDLGRLWLMAVIALLFGLLVRHAVEYDVVLRKAGKPLQLVLLGGAGVFVSRFVNLRRSLRWAVFAAVLMALPTLLLDFQAFAGVGGARGLVNTISAEDVDAMAWLRAETSPKAIIQGCPGYQGEYLYEINPVPPLAERSVAVGTYMLAALWGVGGKAAIARSKLIDGMFEQGDLDQAAAICDSLGIGYLYFGTAERQKYGPDAPAKIAGDRRFELVYDEPQVTILRYRGQSLPRRAPQTVSK